MVVGDLITHYIKESMKKLPFYETSLGALTIMIFGYLFYYLLHNKDNIKEDIRK